MSLSKLFHQVTNTPGCAQLTTWVASRQAGTPEVLHVKNTAGSLPAFLLTHLAQTLQHPLVCILATPDEAAYLYSDLQQFNQNNQHLLLFPPTSRTPYDHEQVVDPIPLIQRADVLQQLDAGFQGLIVTSLEALYEMVPPPAVVHRDTLMLSVRDVLSLQLLVEQLTTYGFERVEFVEEPGEMAVRGGLVDVYPFSGDYPLRVEFFGDEVDTIREFDPRSQRSISHLTTARIVPNLERPSGEDFSYATLFEYLPATTLLALFDEERFYEATQARFDHATELFEQASQHESEFEHPLPTSRYLDGERLTAALKTYHRLTFGTFSSATTETLTLDAKPQPSFHANLDLLRKRLQEHHQQNIHTYILCDSRGQESRLFDLLEEERETGSLTLLIESLHEGFELPTSGLALYTDHQIFNRYHRPSNRKQRRKLGGLSLRDLQNLTPGDFVVHIDYGVGRFAGLQKITVRDKQQEAVRLLFAGEDVLYVNVNALHKLNKFTGKEGHQPMLTKLGSGQWERTKARTKKRIKDIARDLIQLYARRKASKGFAFADDSVWQREMEASFQYEDTPDQASAAEAIKADMQLPIPMDRLVCGDVGFGKTEVAVRAAFKAAQEGKQVAILVPTTVLARQHFETFKKRLARFPMRVEMLSRFRTAKEQQETLKGLKEGTVDIAIGTHRLISKDVDFKDLGLLIIDEEQRFGVGAKEQLRKLRVHVDTLTLTATPIPRTLQFSLLGARDLSIINTPPPNRQPIVTEIHTFDKDLIRDAVLYELSRGGQVFFIHNRVQTIEEIASMLRAMLPDVRIRTAHGQMPPARLEDVMMGFIDKKFDILVSTSIIENGLDISNANTIIINHAERFGLSELHQLRGRVGRSDKKAFCYLLVPSIHTLTREARQRLQAIEEFSDLGSGFNIAMRDLDIRGAGNLLGGEQSGFIEEVGFETYHKILEEAVQELRFEEFQDIFQDAPVPLSSETAVDVEEDALIPESYLSNHIERLNLYRQISEVKEVEGLEALRQEMHDRFGTLPEAVENLLMTVQLKMLGQQLRLPKVQFKNERLFLEMPMADADPYFYDTLFHPLLERLNNLDQRYVLRESTSKKLRAIIQDIPNLATCLKVLEKLTG